MLWGPVPGRPEIPFYFVYTIRISIRRVQQNWGLTPLYYRADLLVRTSTLSSPGECITGRPFQVFPHHPHYGFETVTIVNRGYCDHADSLGAAGRFGMGDVQWMTAGAGVQHSEMFPLLHQEQENPLELFQIWLNLPAKSKQAPPHFKMLWHEQIPVIEEKDNSVRLIAGSFGEHQSVGAPPDSWASETKNQVGILDIRIKAGGSYTLTSAAGAQGSCFVFEGGSLQVNGVLLEVLQGIHYGEGDQVILEAKADSRILVLQGNPIGEPVVQQGPFVTNSQTEMQKAFENYRLTQFGGWPWRHADPVHDSKKGRFALYPDGHEETP